MNAILLLLAALWTAPTSRPTPAPADFAAPIDHAAPAHPPTTQPTTQLSEAARIRAITHADPSLWCQLCAAAAARQAESGEPASLELLDPSVDLMSDLPPR